MIGRVELGRIILVANLNGSSISDKLVVGVKGDKMDNSENVNENWHNSCNAHSRDNSHTDNVCGCMFQYVIGNVQFHGPCIQKKKQCPLLPSRDVRV